MNMVLKALTVMCACCFVTSCASKQAKQDKAQTVQIQDVGGDQTDIFAIPLDTSEYEEEVEMKDLESLETPKKATPNNAQPKMSAQGSTQTKTSLSKNAQTKTAQSKTEQVKKKTPANNVSAK